MTVALIGGAGFIGTRLAKRLENESTPFVILDKVPSVVFPQHSKHCDILSLDDLRTCLVGVTAIINLAAEHKDNVSPVSLYYDVNVTGSKNICQIADELGIKKIIFTSSVAVYDLLKKKLMKQVSIILLIIMGSLSYKPKKNMIAG